MNNNKNFILTTFISALMLCSSVLSLNASEVTVKPAYIEELDDTTFSDALQSDGYLLVNYYTEWLPPSGKFMSKFEQTAEEMHDMVCFAKVNLPKCPKTRKEQTISNVQMTVFYKDGQEVNRLAGPHTIGTLRDFIIEGVSVNNEENLIAKSEGIIINLTEENFSDIIADGVTVVDFYADWCPPCRKFAPIFEEVAEEMHGEVLFGKVNADGARALLDSYGIHAIPTIILFKDQQEQKRHVGPMNTKTFKNFILSGM